MAGATWHCLARHSAIQRSSHVLSIVDEKAYIFGGELIPRQPRGNKTVAIDLRSGIHDLSINEVVSSGEAPAARVGSASTTLSSKLYLFSGRGGPSMSPIEEVGGLWCFDSRQSTWSVLKPSDTLAPYPAARSYHCMTSDGAGKIYLHAGCPASGRLADLWSFSVSERVWTQLADAPGSPRGGASIAFLSGKLYRMNGFDGKHEQGGVLDVYDVQKNEWLSEEFAADGKEGPEARSVSALLPVNIEGRSTLLTLFGERDPSSLGHAGAGKMLGDFWLYDIEDRSWRHGSSRSDEAPPARGWFDVDVFDGGKVVVAGGLSEVNERLDDLWVLSF